MSAFSLRSLSVLAYANGFTLWHYKLAAGPVEPVQETGYFADAADLIAAGDMVLVSGPEAGRLLTVTGTGRAIVARPPQ
jgi:hypothetical protein